jgi:uncharacterized protein (TIGR04255 family)
VSKVERKYKNPPVIEALCEFQFIPSQKWDSTIPGLIYDKVKDKFRIREEQVGIGVKFETTERGVQHRIEPAPPRMQFYSEDRIALIQVAPNLLAVNHLKPYPTWAVFKPMILDALNIYKDVVNPKGFRRIGLRYINRIAVQAPSIEVEDYVSFYAPVPEGLPQVHKSFLARVEIPYDDRGDLMVITVGDASPEKPNETAIILDLDYNEGIPEAILMETCEEWIEQAHSRLEKAFESCITEKSRALFK